MWVQWSTISQEKWTMHKKKPINKMQQDDEENWYHADDGNDRDIEVVTVKSTVLIA